VPGLGRTQALFFDRDGVLNRLVEQDHGRWRPPNSIGEVQLETDSAALVNLARSVGMIPIAITNQPDVARGSLSLETAREICLTIASLLPGLSEMYMCVHDNAQNCSNRKPSPGFLLHCSKRFNISLNDSWIIGDRWVDIAAGVAAGCRTVLLERSYSWDPTSLGPAPDQLRVDQTISSLSELRDQIARLQDTSSETTLL
jgi:D-glycero-D-manno-heptose 1,7-bisphosphate phosphatase